RPTRHRAPRRGPPGRPPAAPASPPPARGQGDGDSREWGYAPARRSRVLAPAPVAPYARPRARGARLRAGADRRPPRAPRVLSGRPPRPADPIALHKSCLPLLLASCCNRPSCPPDGVLPSGGQIQIKGLAALRLPRRSPVARFYKRLPSRRDNRGG